MILPALVMVVVVRLYPVINGTYLSLTDKSLFTFQKGNFIWFNNFFNLIFKDQEFHSVLGFTFAYTFFVVFLSYASGMMIALLLNKDIKYRGFFRTVMLIPWVIPPAVGTSNFLWILNDQFGVVNLFLKNIGFINKSINFLADMSIVRGTVIIYSVWKSFPFMMIVLLSGLQSIPRELYESAYIDGSNRINSFIHITLPLLKKVTFISTTLMSIWTFNNFENIYLLTEGGPVNRTMVLPILTYYTAFFRGEMGYASAIAVLMSVALMIGSLINMKHSNL